MIKSFLSGAVVLALVGAAVGCGSYSGDKENVGQETARLCSGDTWVVWGAYSASPGEACDSAAAAAAAASNGCGVDYVGEAVFDHGTAQAWVCPARYYVYTSGGGGGGGGGGCHNRDPNTCNN